MRPNDLAIVFRLVSADPDSVWGPAKLPKCLHSSDTAASVAECYGRIIGVIIYCGFRAVDLIKNADGRDNRYLMELKQESTAPTACA